LQQSNTMVGVARKHSRKPEEAYHLIEELTPRHTASAAGRPRGKMMGEFKVTRKEARDCRAKAINRYASVPGNSCKWGKSGRRW
jgi:N6-adenosine-specific RNA methylase IME4